MSNKAANLPKGYYQEKITILLPVNPPGKQTSIKMKVVARWNCPKAQPFYVKIINYLRNPSGKLTYEKMKVIARRNCLKVQPFYVKILNYLRNPSGKLTSI